MMVFLCLLPQYSDVWEAKPLRVSTAYYVRCSRYFGGHAILIFTLTFKIGYAYVHDTTINSIKL